MKIVSLQSVGIANLYPTGTTGPLIIHVGTNYAHDSSEQDVTSIELIDYAITNLGAYMGTEHGQRLMSPHYEVKTADGHIRVLPLDYYIAEWAEE